MLTVKNGDHQIAVEVTGPRDGPVLVMAHALGLDHHVFDPVLPHLPGALRIVRYDARGHGASDVPQAPYSMGRIIGDAEAVCTALQLGQVAFLGLSMGGLTGIGLAVKRPDLIHSLILSNTALKIGTEAIWATRQARVAANGMEAIVDETMDRWFHPDFPDRSQWRVRLATAHKDGYLGTCAAIGGTDLRNVVSGLDLPSLCIAGSYDKSTPPDLVRETAQAIPGAEFVLLRRAGHLPCVDHPEAHGAAIAGFMDETGFL